MPKFAAPKPITAAVDVAVGVIDIVADDITEATVEVTPTDPGNKLDTRMVEGTTVDFTDGTLRVRTPRLRMLAFRTGSIQVRMTIPHRSVVRATLGAGDFRATGRLGDCRFKTGAGRIDVDIARGLNLKSGTGPITVGIAESDTSITAGAGDIQIRRVEGTAVIRNASGDNFIDEVTGSVTAKTGSGDIVATTVRGEIDGKTAAGNILIRNIASGAASLTTAAGKIEVGIQPGTAAWLDVDATIGRVHNRLDAATGPSDGDDTARITARNYAGDIYLRRADTVDKDA